MGSQTIQALLDEAVAKGVAPGLTAAIARADGSDTPRTPAAWKLSVPSARAMAALRPGATPLATASSSNACIVCEPMLSPGFHPGASGP